MTWTGRQWLAASAVAGSLLAARPADSQEPRPAAFEVATVKSSPPPAGDLFNINLGTVRNGTLTMSNVSLSDCLRFAYGLVSDDQIAGPDWIKSKSVRFDIVAKAAPETPREAFATMLGPLLADRLKLAFHYEKRDLGYLALVKGTSGLKLREAQTNPPPNAGPSVRGRIVSNALSMLTLATLLSRFERETVVDQTGLPGRYEVHLEWAPDNDRALPAAGPTNNPPAAIPDSRPSLFTAVREQLGLRLEGRKGPLNVLVVDHAEQVPAEN